MTTIAEAVEIAETTGLADRIRTNEAIEQAMKEADRYMGEFTRAIFDGSLRRAGEENEALRNRLHQSEQTILSLQALCDDLESRLVECQARIFVQVAGEVEGVAI